MGITAFFIFANGTCYRFAESGIQTLDIFFYREMIRGVVKAVVDAFLHLVAARIYIFSGQQTTDGLENSFSDWRIAIEKHLPKKILIVGFGLYGTGKSVQIRIPLQSLLCLRIKQHLAADVVVEKNRRVVLLIPQHPVERTAPSSPKHRLALTVLTDGLLRTICLKKHTVHFQATSVRFVFNGFELAHRCLLTDGLRSQTNRVRPSDE